MMLRARLLDLHRGAALRRLVARSPPRLWGTAATRSSGRRADRVSLPNAFFMVRFGTETSSPHNQRRSGRGNWPAGPTRLGRAAGVWGRACPLLLLGPGIW